MSMKYIDMHCDTVCNWLDRNHDTQITFERLHKGNCLVQNFAMFTDVGNYDNPEKRTLEMIDCYYRNIEKNQDKIHPVFRFEDILENERNGFVSSLLTLEEGDVIFGDLAMLRNYYRLGVRMITLTWNYPNRIGYPNKALKKISDNYRDIQEQSIDLNNGLTEFGIQYIQEMERLGMIIDVSHLNDAGFYDVLKYTTKPFVASHSNARGVCDVARNMSDDMIRKLDERHGVMGINFFGQFLKEKSKFSRIEDMVKHIQYIKSITSIDVIGIGTDFDGMESICEIDDPTMMYRLADALIQDGFSLEEVDKIMYKNVLRVYSEIL